MKALPTLGLLAATGWTADQLANSLLTIVTAVCTCVVALAHAYAQIRAVTRDNTAGKSQEPAA